MTLPHLARNAVHYDTIQHVVHAHDWHGNPMQLQTPAELYQALKHQHCYAVYAVMAAGIALCHDHGVAIDTTQLQHYTPLLNELVQLPGTAIPAALVQFMQRLDRANERTARLAIQLCTHGDVLAIHDNDGLFAHTVLRMLARASEMPDIRCVHVHHTAAIPTDTTIVLVTTTVDDNGYAISLPTLPDVPRYVVACSGPSTYAGSIPPHSYHAVVTARGIYRPDRVAQYYRDNDLGGDIISLG